MQEKHHAEYDVQKRARAGTSATLRALVAGYLVYLSGLFPVGRRGFRGVPDPPLADRGGGRQTAGGP